MVWIKYIFGVLLALLMCGPAIAGVRTICNGYKIESPVPITFTSDEKKLICGDKDVESWKEIPRWQAEYFVRNFLQERGFLLPEFTESDNAVLIISGKKSVITKVIVVGDTPPFFKISRRRKTKGAILTPATLSQIENWVRRELSAHGYPCPVVSAAADAPSGVVTLNVAPGTLQNLTSVSEEKVKGLDEHIFRRYDAFKLNKPYNADLLELTVTRTAASGLAQNTHFITECSSDGARITQKITVGRPRLFKVGFGASTEEFLIGKTSWEQTRLGRYGSSIKLSLYGSYRRQEFDAGSKWYFKTSRWYFSPFVAVKRLSERQYQLVSADVGLTPAVSFESSGAKWDVFFGPVLNYTKTLSGLNMGLTRFLSISAGMTVTSHAFEQYAAEPQRGYQLSFLSTTNHRGLFSDATFQYLRLGGEQLWNIGNLSPPLFVLGVRSTIATTIAHRSDSSFSKIPPSYLYYLGGSTNMRGFKFGGLPQSGVAALTSVFGSVEGRFVKILPLDLQPFLFADIGALGDASVDLTFPIYWSPGIGVRYPSPIGVVRTTLSHGFLAHNTNPINLGQSHWQFYFTLGEEF